MGRLSRVAEICILVVTPFVVVVSLPYFQTATKIFPEALQNPMLALIEFFSIYPAMVLLLIFSAAIFGQAGASAYYSMNRKKLNGEILQESDCRPGGILYVTGEFTGKLMNGYLQMTFNTHSSKERSLLFYDHETKTGELHGKFSKEPYIAQYNLPANIPEGVYSVTIDLYDTYTFRLFRTSKFEERKASWQGSVSILTSNPKQVQLDMAYLPESDVLRKFDTSRLPLAGWICIKITNETTADYSDCNGIVTTDAGWFALYDYQYVLERCGAVNGNAPVPFSLQANSEKLVCAKIIARNPTARVELKAGSQTIEKTLQINGK